MSLRRKSLDIIMLHNRITVIGNGWEHMKDIVSDERVFEKCKIDDKKPYFFALGSKYKHKNLTWILNAAKKILNTILF